MRNINIVIFLAAAALLAAGCAKEKLVDADEVRGGETQDVVISLTMPCSQTKTVLGAKDGDSYPVFWQAGDQVSLNGALSAEVPAEDAGSDKTSLYVKDASASAPFNVLYPGEAGVSDKVTFPTEQSYKSGSFAANSLPMYATAQSLSDGFNMKYLGAVLRIPVKFTSATKLKQITLSSVSGEPLGGTFAVGKSDGALNGELSPVNAVSTVYYKFGSSGKSFSSGATGVFYIAIPKGTYSKGIEMKVYDTDGNFMRAGLFSETGSVSAGKVYEFGERAFVPDGTAFFIETVSDLQTFATMDGTRYCLLEAFVLKDIDMTGKTYDAGAFDYYGSLDGGGHTIKGLTKPLFNNLLGSAKNLTVNANITEAVPSGANKYGIGILARYAYVSSGDEEGDYGQVIEGVTTTGSISVSYSPDVDFSIGGMLGANKGIPMSSCENRASVTVTSLTPSVGGTFRVGGLTGSVISGSANISGCSNTGDVTVESAELVTSGSILAVGGLVGFDTKSVTISNSTNSGAVTVNSVTCADGNPYFMIGGIVGDARPDSGFTLSGCENLADGAVTVCSDCSVQSARVGGIIGRMSASDSEITGCINWAPVEIEAAPLSGGNTFGGVVGVVLGDNVEVSLCKNYGSVRSAANKVDAVAGVIGSFEKNGVISTCENYGDVLSTGVPSTDLTIGGVVAKKIKDMTVEFTACANDANVSVSCGAHSKNIHMGGIIGSCPGGNSTFTGCGNTGNLTNNSFSSSNYGSTPAVSIGGIIGRVTDNALGAVSNCANFGDINNNCAAADIRLGGIMGYTHQTLTDITGCSNSGLVSNNVLTDSCYVHVGGILGYTSAKVTMSAQNVNKGKIQGAPTSRVVLYGQFASEEDYDDNIRLAGCIGSYNSSSRGTIVAQKNEGEIVYAGTEACGWVYIGGICGYAQVTAFQEVLNTGYIHNEGKVRDILDMGGILGRGDHTDQARIQSSSVNEGNVFNNGTVSNEARIGGLCGYVAKSMDITNSTNKGTVKNTGTAVTANLGGVCARADFYVSLTGSKNEGDVIFEGSTTNALFMAGIIGYQKSNVNSRIRSVENSGAITCNVDVPDDLEIAGIVADAAGYVDNCTNSGPITIGGNVGKALYVSGICGYNCDNKAMETCENLAGGTITMAGGLSVGNQIFCGGVVGGEPKGKSLTHKGLINRANISFGSSKTVYIATSNTSFSYIGGCVGGNGDGTNANTYENVENYGKVTFYGNHKVRMAGCVAFAPTLSGTLINKADIRYMKQPSTGGNSHVGGIAGYCKNETLSGAVCVGNIDTNDSKTRALTGGIVGCAPSAMTLIKDCKYKGDLRGTSSGASAGLMCSVESANRDISFENCVIGTGSRKTHGGHWRTVTSLVLNYADVSGGGDAHLCGSGSTDTNGTSAGTMTGCTVGSIE